MFVPATEPSIVSAPPPVIEKAFADADHPPITKLLAVLSPILIANAPVLWKDTDAGNEVLPLIDIDPASLALLISTTDAVAPVIKPLNVAVVAFTVPPDRFVAVVAVAALPVHDADEPEVESLIRAESTLTPYVCDPFHPIKVGYVADHADVELVLLTPEPVGDVLAEASNIT
jgi:hypothetical protein